MVDDYTLFLLTMIGLITLVIVFSVLLDVRKRREVMDLMPGEVRVIKRLQETAVWPEGTDLIKPEGKPLYSDGLLGRIRIYQNGIQARFATAETITLLRFRAGYQRRYVVDYQTRFYPYEMIAAMYPIKIGIIRKRAKDHLYRRDHNGGIRVSLNDALNKFWAISDDYNTYGWPLHMGSPREVTTAIQVETKDYRTAILCPNISSGECEVRSVVKALGQALGPRARQLVQLEVEIGGGYFIYEEPGHYDTESQIRYPGDRNRIMLGDLHKHYVLRAQPDYAERRKQANQVLSMSHISQLDEHLRP